MKLPLLNTTKVSPLLMNVLLLWKVLLVVKVLH
jgi:hypothetical protein